MSSPRYKWWSYVKWMIRLYPERKAELRRRQEATVTARYAASAAGGGFVRSTEELGTATLGKPADRETAAVEKAIEETRGMTSGAERLGIIDRMYWKNRNTLQGACDAVHVAYDTGQNYHADFIRCVAKHFDLL